MDAESRFSGLDYSKLAILWKRQQCGWPESTQLDGRTGGYKFYYFNAIMGKH